MRKITLAALALASSAALVGVTAVPAFAATDSTPVTVTVATGVLSIAAPSGTTVLTAAVPGATSTTALGDTVVTDARAGTAGWVADVTLPALTGTSPSTVTIPTTDATYTAGTATKTGTVTVTAATVITGLGTAKTSQTATAVTGNHTATWAASLTIKMPTDVLADTYSGTMTQSVV